MAVTVKYRHRENGLLGEARKCCKQTLTGIFTKSSQDILSEKNPYCGKHLFAKQELITRARLRGQDFATGKNFSFNQCHTKSFVIFLGKVIL